MNSQKQEQIKQQQLSQQQIISNSNPLYSGNSILSAQTIINNPQQNPQMYLSYPQQQQQALSNSLKKNQPNSNNNNINKSFASFLSGVNDIQAQQNSNQANLCQQQQQPTIMQQSYTQQQVKGLQIQSFIIKIIEGKLKLANSADLKPFVQVQFGKRIWRTQINKGSYPKWNEEKKFDILSNKGFDLTNPGGVCNSSVTTQSSCSSISPQTSQNQQIQIFQQQQLLNGQYQVNSSGQVDFNIEIVVLHKSENEEIELGRTSINVEEQQQQTSKWFIIENNGSIFGSVQIQFQFEYANYQLQINKTSHQIYLNQKTNQKQQQQQVAFPQYNYQKSLEDLQNSKQPQAHLINTASNSVNHTPNLNINKRNPSSHSENNSFQDFQIIPQTTSRVALVNQNGQDSILEPISKVNLGFSGNSQMINNNISSNNLGYQCRQYDMSDLISQLQQEHEFLLKRDRILQEKYQQAQADSQNISKEQLKLEQQQQNIKLQESQLRQRQSGLEQQKDDFEKQIIRLEESKKILHQYIQEYQNLAAEEQELQKSTTKIRSDVKIMNEEEPEILDTLNTLSRRNNSEILQLKIFKLKMINHLKEINSIFYNQKASSVKKPLNASHQRAKSFSNHYSLVGVDTITDYTVTLKNLQNKISGLKDIINTKNLEIENLRDQICQIQSSYDGQ
ncbi:hypothetical protein TTHERM_00028650 (macronuclear) [Tetrahymena thermophila SB210]|uniref:C2 domain-containing protein n=1 Tax=Tetrahymena thermophila (strain SB210) TaxID=312017 RepID=Q22N09_TETTS|nr:hypothetical protein TTHERM_00028650 [Tetrahymena thermophila SB210]EAR86443.2 hypothetical protein TTHERM_00028650 [Tetrahymena thermophila SB210]|eukprot:XP_976861.2 hypothetical protein TTHERM_00028650 [Tetrahymena thermophila SB210]